MRKSPVESILNAVGSRLTSPTLFLLVGQQMFHLKHYTKGIRRTVAIGSQQSVGVPELPPLLGKLKVGGLGWCFTPAVEGVTVNGDAVRIGATVSMRPLSTIRWWETEIIGKLPYHVEYQRLITECPLCRRTARR